MKYRFLAVALCVCLFVPTSTVLAVEMEADQSVVVEYQTEDVHYLTEDLTRGSKKPGVNASVHDLSISNYNYQLTNFGYRLFTDKWLTSESGQISVSLSNFQTLEDYGGTNNKITFKLCDSSGVLVTSERTVSNGSASVTWINIKADKKYYVCFEVLTNGNRYSGYGYISD